MQKTSSNASHIYKPLPKKDPSCSICASPSGDAELIIGLLYFSSLWLCIGLFTGCIPRVHVLTSTCPREDPAAQDSNDLFQLYTLHLVLHLSTKRPSPALWSMLLQVLLPSFYKGSELLTRTFHLFFLFSPYSFYSLFHIKLLDDTWNRIRSGVNWSSCTLMPLTYVVKYSQSTASGNNTQKQYE